MEIPVMMVKELREKTGVSIIECKKALTETKGDLEKAIQILKQQGLAIAEKKANRVVSEGAVEAYVHPGGRIGAIIEVNCETDFVARTDEFKKLIHDLALQVVAMAPKFISPAEIPPGANLKPQEACLLLQPFIKDNNKTVQDLINEVIAKVGENIKVRRFARFELGYYSDQ